MIDKIGLSKVHHMRNNATFNKSKRFADHRLYESGNIEKKWLPHTLSLYADIIKQMIIFTLFPHVLSLNNSRKQDGICLVDFSLLAKQFLPSTDHRDNLSVKVGYWRRGWCVNVSRAGNGLHLYCACILIQFQAWLTMIRSVWSHK